MTAPAPTTRTKLYYPINDENGALRRYSRVTVYAEDGVTPFPGPIYRDALSAKTWSNPFIASPALVEIYFDTAVRVVLGLLPDASKPVIVTDVLDVEFLADQTVSTALPPLQVTGTSTPRALLCALDANTAFWKPLRIDHEHALIAPGSTLTGPMPVALRQTGDFPGSTVLGANAGGWGAASSLARITVLGASADGYGRDSVAVGFGALASESAVAPWSSGSVALGANSFAEAAGVALGARANASATTGSGSGLLGSAVALGSTATTRGPAGLAIGQGADASARGVALGALTGSSSSGPPGSIGIGAGAQYGLPSDAVSPAVLLGAHDPAMPVSFPWSNPAASQSESPLAEYAPAMSFTGPTVQLQRTLQWLINNAGLTVTGNVSLGSHGGALGFFGAPGMTQPAVGDDEPASGIPALDSLIYALRDLGMLSARTPAVTAWRADDLTPALLDNDPVARWPEHYGRDVAASSGQALPSFRAADAELNGFPSVLFRNGVHERFTLPVQEMRGANLLPNAKHFLAVGEHSYPALGAAEGLFNLSGGEAVTGDDTVLMADSPQTWSLLTAAGYYRNGLNQSANRQVHAEAGAQLWRMTSRTTWPHAVPILGGPRDQGAAHAWDNWSGTIAEVVGVDDTWDEAHVESLERGLMFRYGINQDEDWLAEPARDFITTQHDPAGGVYVFWDNDDCDYDDRFTGRVHGRAVNVAKPVDFVEFISIFIWFDDDHYRGSLLGNWGNCSNHEEFEIVVTVRFSDFDDYDDYDDLDFALDIVVGTFTLENNFTWSMGHRDVDYGRKRCHVRHRETHEIVCISGRPTFRYRDTEVRVYSTQPDGSLHLEDTVPLWGDGTFKARFHGNGYKVARVYETSTGNLLGTTEYQDRALPRSTVYALDDADYSFANADRAGTYEAALAAMAFAEMPRSYRYRARHILATFAQIINAEGSFEDHYSASLPAASGVGSSTTTTPARSPAALGRAWVQDGLLAGELAGTAYSGALRASTVPSSGAGTKVWASAWVLLAVLAYQKITGDTQFQAMAVRIGNYLRGLQQPGGGIATAALTYPTSTNVVCYFALRDLGVLTGDPLLADVPRRIAVQLLSGNWVNGRFWLAAGNDAEALTADVFGGVFLAAIGDQTRLPLNNRHLKRYRVKGITVGTNHYSGPSGLIGYRPYAELGANPYVNPPSIIDQTHTWVAILAKQRYGEPVGTDVASLFSWAQNRILSDPSHRLYGAQFLSYSGSAVAAPYGLTARPYLGAAAWGYLLSAGARHLLVQDPAPVPSPVGLAVTAVFSSQTNRYAFTYTWTSVAASAGYEAVPELSTNGGTTWSGVAASSVTGSTQSLRSVVGGVESFTANWSVPIPPNPATVYRVRVRLRTAVFGPWAISNTVSLPPAV